MSLLLAVDAVELYPPGGSDDHGWVEAGARPYWCGPGNLQLTAGVSDPRASGGGGHGPHAPARAEAGTLFLPPEVTPLEGSAARVRGQVFVLAQVRLINDPVEPGGGITCWAASITEVSGG